MADFIHFHLDQGVAQITLNRPAQYNAFNQQMALELQKTLDLCASDKNVRSIYLTGSGKAFCSGQDLKEVTDPNGPELTTIVRDHYNPIIRRLTMIEKPVVAAVNGVAAGAGANIALACDVVVARKSASFIQAFSKIGLIPDSGGTYMLPRLIGFQKALAVAMLGDKIGAEEAEEMGMIYKWFEDDDFEGQSLSLAQKLAKMPTRGLGLTKRAFHLGLRNDLNSQLDIEEKLQSEAGLSYDYQEGVAAFLEKRKPNFKGE